MQKLLQFHSQLYYLLKLHGFRLHHSMSTSLTIFCDVTGTITSLEKLDPQKRLLYYAIAVSSPNHSPPVAVCNLITADHSVLSLSTFLKTFRYSEGTLYGFSKVVTPRHILIDRSLVHLKLIARCIKQIEPM